MTLFLSSYKKTPIYDYFLARIRFSEDNIQGDLDCGLNIAVINRKKHAVTFYPWNKEYPITDSEWVKWSTLHECDAISIAKSGINYGYLQQVSTDDTVFGLIKEEPDSTKAIKPPLLQYIGKSNLETNCHIKALSNVKELMICSDGLTDLVETDDIEEILEKYTVPMEMVHMLYNKAMENGGYDNISIVYIQLENDK